MSCSLNDMNCMLPYWQLLDRRIHLDKYRSNCLFRQEKQLLFGKCHTKWKKNRKDSFDHKKHKHSKKSYSTILKRMLSYMFH